MKSIVNSFDDIFTDIDLSDVIDFFNKFNSTFENEFLIYWNFYIYFSGKGKVKIASLCLDKFIFNAIKYKRIHLLKKIVNQFNAKNEIEAKRIVENNLIIFQGINEENYLNSWHNYNSQEILENEILNENTWNLKLVKNIYEYVIVYKFKNELYWILDKNISDKYKAEWIKFTTASTTTITDKDNKISINLDYDLVEFNKKKILESEDEDGVIASLKYEIFEKSFKDLEELTLAFKMSSMNKAVVFIVDHLNTLELDIKKRASFNYIKQKAYFDSNEFLKVIHDGEAFLDKYPLLAEEKMPILNIMFDSALKLENLTLAKKLCSEINKIEKNFKNINERLKKIEQGK